MTRSSGNCVWALNNQREVVEDRRTAFELLGTSLAVTGPNSLTTYTKGKRKIVLGLMIAATARKNMVSIHAEENPISSHGSLLVDIAFGTTSLRRAERRK